MNCTRYLSASFALFLGVALSTNGQVVELPSLSIEGTDIQSSFEFDTERGVYIYEYTMIAADSNLAPVRGFSVNVRGRSPRTQIDRDLRENISRDEKQLQPDTTIPVGVIVPDPTVPMLVGPTMTGRVSFGYWTGEGSEIQPGETRTGFKLESKFPPAWREAEIRPSKASWEPIEAATAGPGVEYSWKDWDLKTEVLAPYDLDESALFPGGGQSPREVNVFLQYVAPTESRNQLPVGTERYDVTVRFGPTTNVASFSATLDGEDVTSWFRPMAGVIDTVTIPLKPGTTKLQLSIEGQTSSGRTARDTDTLTFIVK